MGTDNIIKWTNRIALFSIILLVYWVFIFISITVFDFKVFRENITETFYLSILGILALLAGSIVVNIMFNLTKISSNYGVKGGADNTAKKMPKAFILFLVSFPIIFGLLYFGDLRSSAKKESLIRKSALSLINENPEILKQLVNYEFTDEWRKQTKNHVRLLEKIDESFPNIQIILIDAVEGKPVFLSFSDYYYKDKDKSDFIYSCSAEERAFLKQAFGGDMEDRFSASDGFYELYCPVKIDGKIMVIYLSERQRYGKLGS